MLIVCSSQMENLQAHLDQMVGELQSKARDKMAAAEAETTKVWLALSVSLLLLC
jgi:hypothetical protein